VRVNAHVAHTSSHSLSIGEHGVRGGGAPTNTCCTTFWCSTIDTGTGLQTLDARIANFLHTACHIPLPKQLGHMRTWGRRPCGGVFIRVLCEFNEHVYACVFMRDDRGVEMPLHFVFDISTDPEETENIMTSVVHLHINFYDVMRTCTASPVHARTTRTSRRPPPVVSLPSPVRVEPSTRVESTRVEATRVEATRVESTRVEATRVAPPDTMTAMRPPPVMTQPLSPSISEASTTDILIRKIVARRDSASNVRRVEARLNNMHR